MKPKTEEQLKREIRHLKIELKNRDTETRRLEKANYQLKNDLDFAKHDLNTNERLIKYLRKQKI
jgi:hypothetical protein